ncbi:MAG: DUF1868 domain-containing protein, partial [Inhella sp.]
MKKLLTQLGAGPSAPAQLHRRRVLLAAAGLPALAAAAQAAAPSNAKPEPTGPSHPRDVGRKFYADGRPMTFAGNTFLGHVPQQGAAYEMFDQWLDISREMPQHAFARKLSLVPTSSWHVTLMGGVNDVDRATPVWPSDLPRDMPMDEIHRRLLQRVQGRRTPILAPCNFVVDTDAPAPLL